MTTTQLLKSFRKMNSDEEFYKQCFLMRGEKLANQEFLNKLDLEYIVKNNLILKESAPRSTFILPDEFTDESHFSVNNRSNIIILRHNRYTPVFYHKHTFFEFVIVISGTCDHLINETSFKMNTGDMCFVPPGVYHSLSVFNKSIVLTMLIKKTFLSDVLFDFFISDNTLSNFFTTSLFCDGFDQYLMFHTNGDQDIINLILEIYLNYHSHTRFRKQITENQTVILFAKLLQSYENTVEQNEISKYRNSKSSDFIMYIEQHIRNVTLESMAQHFGYALPYLSKKIKQSCGYNYNEIVHQLKQQKAEQLLAKTTLSINEISERLGYLNPENFIRNFKLSRKISPTEFKKRLSKPD